MKLIALIVVLVSTAATAFVVPQVVTSVPQQSIYQLLRQPTVLQPQLVTSAGVSGVTPVVSPSAITPLVTPSVTPLISPSSLTSLFGQPAVNQFATSDLQQLILNSILQQQQLTTSNLLPYLNNLNLGSLAGLSGYNVGNLQFPFNSGLTGLTTTNVNGVPVVVPTSNFQTVVPATTPLVSPVVGVNPVIRQVDEEEKTAVELDPMDAALLDMEKKGLMHMEKYAFGRSALDQKERSTVPLVVATLPNGYVTSPVVPEVVPVNKVIRRTQASPSRVSETSY